MLTTTVGWTKTVMTNADIIKLIEERVFEMMLRAKYAYGTNFPSPEIKYKLTGQCAGRAKSAPKHTKKLGWVNFNLDICRHNLTNFLKRTVRHEIAHLIDVFLYGRTRPHGRNWAMVMWKLGEKRPSRCHSYDMSKVKTRRMKKHYVYKCNCEKPHNLTIIRHRRIVNNGKKFKCRDCKKLLEYTGRATHNG